MLAVRFGGSANLFLELAFEIVRVMHHARALELSRASSVGAGIWRLGRVMYCKCSSGKLSISVGDSGGQTSAALDCMFLMLSARLHA